MNGKRFLEENDRQYENKDKCETHKRIGKTQVKLCHGCHPEKRCYKSSDET